MSSLRSKRFRFGSEQRETRERDFRAVFGCPSLFLICAKTKRKRLLRRLTGEHSRRRRLHLWLKTERTKHGIHDPHTGNVQSGQSILIIFIFHDLESHILLQAFQALLV